MDGAVAYRIELGAASSSDANFQGLDPADVDLTNTDNDVAGIAVTPIAGLTTSEAGATASFTVVLGCEPMAPVVFTLTSSNPNEGTLSENTLTFDASNWNVPQTVTVTGADEVMSWMAMSPTRST
jgi:hypothetical protein